MCSIVDNHSCKWGCRNVTRESGGCLVGYSDDVDPTATQKFQRPRMRDGICSMECGSQRNASPSQNVCVETANNRTEWMNKHMWVG